MTLTHQTNAFPNNIQTNANFRVLFFIIISSSSWCKVVPIIFKLPKKIFQTFFILFYLKISAYRCFNPPQCFACRCVKWVHRLRPHATVWISLQQTALKQRETLPTCCNCGSAYTENCHCCCYLARNEWLKLQVQINSILLLKYPILPSKHKRKKLPFQLFK